MRGKTQRLDPPSNHSNHQQGHRKCFRIQTTLIAPYFRQFPTALINIALIGREFQDVFHATKKLSIEEISPFDVYIYHTMSFSFLQSFSIHQTLKTHTLAALHVCLKVANLCL